ncbi:preprotein translocase subunit SecG [Proteiniborus sp.]|uniref:preprotein translocase subunit SecG n=1 Tax=Proteiniborus sp. TaxID=2079015 RepID=UPI00333003A8
MTIFFYVLIVLASLALIASILLQSGKSAGLSGSIGGGAESIWGRSKGRSFEGILSKLTTISAIVFVISALVLTALQ